MSSRVETPREDPSFCSGSRELRRHGTSKSFLAGRCLAPELSETCQSQSSHSLPTLATRHEKGLSIPSSSGASGQRRESQAEVDGASSSNFIHVNEGRAGGPTTKATLVLSKNRSRDCLNAKPARA